MYFLGVSKPHTASIPREKKRERERERERERKKGRKEGRKEGLKEGRKEGRKEDRQTDRQTDRQKERKKERKKEQYTYLPVPKSCFRQVTSMSIHCKSFRQGFCPFSHSRKHAFFCQPFCGFSFKP